MATKQVKIEGIGMVSIHRRSGTRSVRLSIAADNAVRVTIPAWLPFRAGVEFARAKQAWIRLKQQPQTLLEESQAVGKAHHLRFVATTGAKVTSRIRGADVFIGLPQGVNATA